MDNIKTFNYKNFKIEIHPEVYEPAEDTFFLLEVIKIDNCKRVLDLGTGCGIIALDCTRKARRVVGTDINPHAINCANKNLELNRHYIDSIVDFRKGDLFSVINKGEKFDLIIFNPPYLPTKYNEKIDGWLNFALDGGEDGLSTTKKFLENVGNFLFEKGKAYFIFNSLSNQEKLENILKIHRLKSEIVSKKWLDTERIDIYCITND